jgi:uncharacterized protein DUF6973
MGGINMRSNLKKILVGTVIVATISSNTLISTNVYALNLNQKNNIVYNQKIDYTELLTVDEAIKLGEEMYQYKVSNPNISETGLDNILKEKILSNSRTRIRTFEYTDLPYVKEHLNEDEQALFNESLYRGTRVLNLAYNAVKITERTYKKSYIYLNNGDAFRHCYWNGLMSNELGRDTAKKWSDAHESGDPYNTEIDKEMDLFNNEVGLDLGQTITGNRYFAPRLQHAILEKIDNGELLRVLNPVFEEVAPNIERPVDGDLVSTDNTGRKY